MKELLKRLIVTYSPRNHDLYRVEEVSDDEFSKTELVQIEDLPPKDGFYTKLTWNDADKKFEYVYVEIIKSEEQKQLEKIIQLENAMMELASIIASSDVEEEVTETEEAPKEPPKSPDALPSNVE